MKIDSKDMAMPITANIVCVGSWNTKIFTPEWLAGNIFQIENIEGLLNNQEMDFAFRDKNRDITIFPKSTSLEITLAKFEESKLTDLVLILNRILSLLPHTPIKGIGFNLNYEIGEKPVPAWISTLSKKSQIIPNGIQISNFSLRKNYENYILNININEITKVINFNFHYEIADKKTSLFKETIFSEYLSITDNILENE